MNLIELVDQYVAYRQALGEKFKTNQAYLRAFCAAVGGDTSIGAITGEIVHRFLYGSSSVVTTGWFVKHTAISGLYRYAVSRNLVQEIPIPKILPKRPQGLVPYIYSRQELKRLFDGALTYQKNKSHIDPYMVRVSLMLTYMLGLRVHETLSLTISNIDMENQVVTVWQSKFYKSRLVPFNKQVEKLLVEYLQWRKTHPYPQGVESSLFINRRGQPLKADTLRELFHRIRDKAGIRREDGAAFQPRLHDLRHTFATDRLLSWYRQNKDVQQLLPFLSVYMGHSHLAHTSVYLSTTDELLREAGDKFENYVKIQEP
ncbi:tyrosine-type recombinase/integrase [Dyadobacter psychrophilus]|uniref:Site-specific recombinase XerD n=1 Tax=Dyadobacter psychrophilus TaxID=651661 RepID=A0A1T5FHX9_9BACT|nr:tyrosine-type recombinase/integrase [Dyadobacter psychrophilus]SKB95781.1 Site-specific recombinase XerD [Dyadobacter psychrophilus]